MAGEQQHDMEQELQPCFKPHDHFRRSIKGKSITLKLKLLVAADFQFHKAALNMSDGGMKFGSATP